MICLNFDIQSISDFLNKWQSLSGAFLGASTPILFALFLRWRDSRKDFLRGIYRIERFLVYSINDLYDLRDEVFLFLEEIKRIRIDAEKNLGNNFIVDSTNFPLKKLECYKGIFETKFKSLYLSNKIIHCYRLNKNTNDSICEIAKEYQFLKEKNYDLILSGKIDKLNQNQERIKQLQSIESVLNKINSNLIVITKVFLSAKIILYKYYFTKGDWFRRIYYEGFFGKKTLREKGGELIDEKIELEVNGEFLKLNNKK